MTHGIDTDFLVAAEIRDHPFHRPADDPLQTLLADGHDLALVPQTLAEFIHRVITNNERGFRGFGCFEIVTFRP
jgi:predicted nucleic acid-binding protein